MEMEHATTRDLDDTPSPPSPGEVAAVYDERTQRVLDKYAVDSICHYHSGVSDGSFPSGASTADLTLRMHAAQEVTMDVIVDGILRWAKLPGDRRPDLLDIGCGLGGGPLRLAQRLGAQVRAITVAAEHVPVVRRFAEQAGLADRIEAAVEDANQLTAEAGFDVAVAHESVCHMDRRRLFRGVARALRPGGSFHLIDWMRGRHCAAADRVDAWWHTRMGTPQEYRRLSAEAGFQLVHEAALQDETWGFYALAAAWNLAALGERRLDPAERARLERSTEENASLAEALRTSQILDLHMVFVCG
jgi:tocopherol O-methyltransferase